MSETSDLAKENARLRELLLEVTRLEDPAALPELQARITRHLSATDRRRQRSGFSTPEAREAIAETRRQQVAERQAQFGPTMRRLAGEGLSLDAIAKALNEAGIPAPSGGAWAKGSVKFQLDRLPAE